jgi:hypothetical protein
VARAGGGTSLGALWVAGVGAFLLVAAAATFVAVRWDDIHDGVKLAALIAVTLVCLQAYLWLRSTLPQTASVLLHLGVLLVPIDVAALGARADWTWHEMLLAQGITATVVFGLAARAERSVVLRAATWGGVVMLAGGIGGVTAAPAGVVLSAVALAVVLARRSELELEGAAWAVLAGLAMPLAGGEDLGVPAAGVLGDLGLVGDASPWASATTGLLAGVTLGIVGGRRRNVPAALAGIGCVLAGATTAWLTWGGDDPSLDPDQLDLSEGLLALAALALLAEAAAWTWRADVFWFRPTHIVATLGELVTTMVTLGCAGLLLALPHDADPEPLAALATGLFALTWTAATARRSPAATLAPAAWAAPTTATGAAPGAATGPFVPPSSEAATTADRPPARPGVPTAGQPASEAGATSGRLQAEPAAARDERSPAAWIGQVRATAPRGTPRPVVLFGPFAAALTATAAILLATGSGSATGWALTVFGGAVVLSWPRLPMGSATSGALAVGLLTWAPVAAFDGTPDGQRALLTAALGMAGALMVSAGVVNTTASLPPRQAAEPALLLSPLALLPLAVAASLLAADSEGVAATVLGLVGVWLVAGVLDLAGLERLRLPVHHDPVSAWLRAWPAPPGQHGPAGGAGVAGPGLQEPHAAARQPRPLVMPQVTLAVRCVALLPLAGTLALAPHEAAAVAGLAAGLAVLDAVRRGQPWLLLGAAFAVPVVAGALALEWDASLAGAGLVVTLTGVAWLGLAGVLPERWAGPALAASVVAGSVGLVLCSGERETLASYLLVVGTAMAAAGVALVQKPLVAAGAGLALVGFWSHLSLAEVQASEPYIAPAAGLAVAAGMAARQRQHVSSWIAYTPPAALLGGAALFERLAGGSAWHALVAGAVGIVAVAAGAVGRLAGPLLVGTALVVAVTVHETLGVTARFPTWVWLGSGGLVLLITGIVMERRDTGPVETGRRLVDLVREQFT